MKLRHESTRCRESLGWGFKPVGRCPRAFPEEATFPPNITGIRWNQGLLKRGKKAGKGVFLTKGNSRVRVERLEKKKTRVAFGKWGSKE